MPNTNTVQLSRRTLLRAGLGIGAAGSALGVSALALSSDSGLVLPSHYGTWDIGQTLATYIAGRPTWGPAWATMKQVADDDAGTADLSNQDNLHATRLLAKALVYRRIGGESYRSDVEAGVRAAIATEENASSDQQLLAMSRQITAYVLCAGLIDLDPSVGSTASGRAYYSWGSWLATIRSKDVGSHGAWRNLTQCHEDTDNNWGTFCGVSRLAVALALGDTADVARIASVHRRWLGDRSAFRRFPRCKMDSESWDPSYVSLEPPLSWLGRQSERFTWLNRVAINARDCAGGMPYDGILVMDLARSGGQYDGRYGGWDESGAGYAWGALEGAYVTSFLLRTAGFRDAFRWSDDALRRSVAWLHRAGDVPHRGSHTGSFVPWMTDYFYGTRYAGEPAGYGRCLGYTDWLFAD